MNKLAIIFLLLVINSARALGLPEDFWENCPGPACPGNIPDYQDMEAGLESREEELIRKERELLERERILIDRELRYRDKEL
ncbi:MAG: hypothetical protein AB2689_05985 [Candidatus Thiodiazotropha taylori]